MRHYITHRLVVLRKRLELRVSRSSSLKECQFLKDEIILSVFCKYLLKDASYRKRSLFMQYSPLNCASIGGTRETIGATGETVERFEIMSFFERRNNFLRFLQISPKGRILHKKASLY